MKAETTKNFSDLKIIDLRSISGIEKAEKLKEKGYIITNVGLNTVTLCLPKNN